MNRNEGLAEDKPRIDHSQLPWRVRVHPQNKDQFFIEASKNSPDHPYDIEVMGEDTGKLYPDAQKRADADFIVKAVNCHDELVATLRLAVAQLEGLGSDGLASGAIAILEKAR